MRRVSLAQVMKGRTPTLWSGQGQLAFHPTATVAGISLSRQLLSAQISPLATLIQTALHRRPRLTTFVLDVSRLEGMGMDPDTFASFKAKLLTPLAVGTGRPERLVLAGTKRIGQLAVIGALAVMPGVQWRATNDLATALERCAPPSERPAWLDPLLSAIQNELQPMGIVSRVRGELGERPAASLGEVADRLGLAPRSLQRALAEAATTFAHERGTLRVELAAERLCVGDKLSAVASSVGYRSASRFAEVFRSRFGVSPAAFARRSIRPSQP